MSDPIIIKANEYGHINVGSVNLAQKESNADAFINFYTGISWALFKNSSYDKNILGEFPNEFYASKSAVPKYRVFNNGVKIGHLFPRETDNGYKFIVIIVAKRNQKTMKKYNQLYYISSGFDKDFNIIMPTDVTRKTKSNAF